MFICVLFLFVGILALKGQVCERLQTFLSTCSGAHAPGGQPVGCGKAVEHADVLWRQELHKLGVLERVSFAVEYGRGLVWNVHYPPCAERHGHRKDVLPRQTFKGTVGHRAERGKVKVWVTHVVFEGVFWSNAVNLFYGIRGHIQAWRLTVVDHQQLVILLIGCTEQGDDSYWWQTFSIMKNRGLDNRQSKLHW